MQRQLKCLVGVCVGIVVLLAAGRAGAMDVQLTGQVTAAFDYPPFNYVPLPNLSRPQPEPVNLEYGIFIEVSDLAPDERYFGAIEFDISLSDGVVDQFGYIGDESMFEPPPPGPGGIPIWNDNRDMGPADLQQIRASVIEGLSVPAFFPEDTRTRVGQDGPTLLGSLYLEWDGTAPQTIGLTVRSLAVVDNTTGHFRDVTDTATYSGDLDVLGVPEPAGLTLAGWALVGLAWLAHRRCG